MSAHHRERVFDCLSAILIAGSSTASVSHTRAEEFKTFFFKQKKKKRTKKKKRSEKNVRTSQKNPRGEEETSTSEFQNISECVFFFFLPVTLLQLQEEDYSF